MKTAKKKTFDYIPPYPIRQSQMISPWGIGAMIDFPNNESLMICGLDVWSYPDDESRLEEFIIREDRLQKRLKVSHFRYPPDFRKSKESVNPYFRIPVVRFPEWHFCDWCGGLEQLTIFGSQQRCSGIDYKKGKSCYSTHKDRRRFLIPLRFVAACEKGHIRDFPWMEWVHEAKPITSKCRLRLTKGSSASLKGLYVNCECDNYKTLSGAFNENALEKIVVCGGQRPWLGDTEDILGRCNEPLKVLQKGGSNVFFPIVISSIHIPPTWGDDVTLDILTILDDPGIWGVLASSTIDGKLDEAKCRFTAEIKKVDPDKFLHFAKLKFEGDLTDEEIETAISEEKFRQDEYNALLEGKGDINSDLTCRKISPDKYDFPVNEYLTDVTLVDQLRETKAFAGFTRVIPKDDYKLEEKISQLRLDNSIDWLPAVIVRGEGIFFKLNEERIKEWASDDNVLKRAQELSKNYYGSYLEQEKIIQANISPKFILLHTLAHMVINQLSFDCGYGSSSLRERIYCDLENAEYPMSGILIYTASGDSEGTMGGLVRQGNIGNLEKTFIRSLKKALWCSSDPVCIESKGQGPGSCNLAACHSCALLPETSCEKGNKLLDRGMVVGTASDPGLGFFSDVYKTFEVEVE